jgi:hypothetical protein
MVLLVQNAEMKFRPYHLDFNKRYPVYFQHDIIILQLLAAYPEQACCLSNCYFAGILVHF